MKNYKKGFAPIAVLIIAVAIIGGGIYYYSHQDTKIQQTSSQADNPDQHITPDPSKPSSITVTSPREGDIIKVGDKYTVTWTSKNVGDQYVFISFTDIHGKNARWPSEGFANTGSHTFEFNPLIVPGQYKIAVYTAENIPSGANTAGGLSGVVTVSDDGDNKKIPINENTQNLKLYSNTNYGFEFEYPKEWGTLVENIVNAHVEDNAVSVDFISNTNGIISILGYAQINSNYYKEFSSEILSECKVTPILIRLNNVSAKRYNCEPVIINPKNIPNPRPQQSTFVLIEGSNRKPVIIQFRRSIDYKDKEASFNEFLTTFKLF